MRTHELHTVLERIETVDFIPDDEMEINVASAYDEREDHLTPLGKVNNFPVMAYWEPDQQTCRLFVVDGERPVAQMLIARTDFGSDYFQVQSVWVLPEYRSQGIAGRLYDNLITKGVRLVSDTQQTPKGRDLWRHLAQKYRVFLARSAEDMVEAKQPSDIDAVYRPFSRYRFLMVSR